MSVYTDLKNWCKANCDKEVNTIYEDAVDIIKKRDPELQKDAYFYKGTAFCGDDKNERLFIYSYNGTYCDTIILDCKNPKKSIQCCCEQPKVMKNNRTHIGCEYYENKWSLTDTYNTLYEVVNSFNKGCYGIKNLISIPEKLVGTAKDLEPNELKYFRAFCHYLNTEAKELKAVAKNYSSTDEYFDDNDKDSYNRNETVNILTKDNKTIMTIMKANESGELVFKVNTCDNSSFRVITATNHQFDWVVYDITRGTYRDTQVSSDIWNCANRWDINSLI